jgi:hypothetical protein
MRVRVRGLLGQGSVRVRVRVRGFDQTIFLGDDVAS